MVETYGYQRKTSRQHRQIYKVWRPQFNLLLVSDDSCMKTCERSRRLRAAELNPLQPAAVCAESTSQPNEGIYSAAQTCGRGQRTINSDPQISADMMNILQSTQACQKILHLKYDVFRSASVHRHLMFAQKFAEKQNYSFVYLFSGQTFSIYSSDTNMSGHGGFSLIKPLLTRRTWFQHHWRDEGCCCKLCTARDSVISRIKQGDFQPIYEKAPRAIVLWSSVLAY